MLRNEAVKVGIAFFAAIFCLYLLSTYDALDDSTRVSDVELPATSISVEKPVKIDLPDDIRFLHIGKAGGGTVQTRISKVWRANIQKCHPHPCIERKWKHDKTLHPYFLICLRDPVDRFLSAFYWRLLRVCHPDPSQQQDVEAITGRECRNGNKGEAEYLFHRFDQNASQLALDLCSKDKAVAVEARKALSVVGHAQHSIHDWLDFPWHQDRVYPVVLEHGAPSIDSQTDQAMVWLYNRTHFDKPARFQRRAEYVKRHQSQLAKNHHSSSSSKKSLTPAAERCLEQFYAKDYLLLSDIQDKMCKTEACKVAIQDILDRRT